MIHLVAHQIFAADNLQIVSQRLSASWPWYIIRASGFVAAGLLILLMISGIAQATGLTYRFIEPIKAWAIHKALALALCASIVIHGGFLLIDHFVHFSLGQILVPFMSTYSNGTKLFGIPLGWAAVSMGILAMYSIAIIVSSSLGWIDTKKGIWRKLHYLSYVAMGLVFLHALYIGSDLKYGTFRAGWIFLGLIVAVAVIYRLGRRGSLKR